MKMATKRNTSGSKSSASSKTGSSGEQKRLDDVTYDVIAVLHEKSQALEAYDQYLEDAEDHDEVREIFEEIRDQDEQHVARLEQCLRTLVSGESSEEEEAA
jgi:hypothetical protein